MLPGSKVVKVLALNNAICSANILKCFKFEWSISKDEEHLMVTLLSLLYNYWLSSKMMKFV